MTLADVPAASAPGKLVVMGEYAVLDGHEAVVAAMDVRARVFVGDVAELVLEGNTSGTHDRASAREHLPLLAAVLDEIERRGERVAAGHYRVDTAAFARAGKKVGLGSSAAACVAFTRAVLARAAHVDGRVDGVSADELFSIARAAHRTFQGGGSGIDIAAATYGGLVRFSLAGTTTSGARASRGLVLPRGLTPVVVFTGVSTSTQGFVDRYLALPDRAAHARALADAARAFIDACTPDRAASDAASDAVRALDDARRAMASMGGAAGIDVVSAAHARIAVLADEHGGAAKPSGAGGGDVAIALLPDDSAAKFLTAVARDGFTVVPARVDPVGAAP